MEDFSLTDICALFICIPQKFLYSSYSEEYLVKYLLLCMISPPWDKIFEGLKSNKILSQGGFIFQKVIKEKKKGGKEREFR